MRTKKIKEEYYNGWKIELSQNFVLAYSGVHYIYEKQKSYSYFYSYYNFDTETSFTHTLKNKASIYEIIDKVNLLNYAEI